MAVWKTENIMNLFSAEDLAFTKINFWTGEQ